MKIAMIGAGYVGLTTGACLSRFGNSVCCVDINQARVDSLRAGNIPIYEPGLSDLIKANVDAGRLTFSSSAETAVADADLVFLAVGTPPLPDGDTDLQFILGAVDAVAPHMRSDAVLVVKSTVPTGAAQLVRKRAVAARGGRAVSVASNPEFLREGSALEDFMAPDRVVIGADDGVAEDRLRRLYAPLADLTTLLVTSTANAELIKYAANAFLALKIGFINDIADLCEATGGDCAAVSKGIGLDSRIGEAFLRPGPGFGGSCFPKDTRSLAATGRRYGAPQPLVEALVERNLERQVAIGRRLSAVLGAGSRVTVLGAAFKAGTDDLRESPALAIVDALLEDGHTVHIHDPKAREVGERLVTGAKWSSSPYEAAAGADAVVVATEWPEFAALDFERLARMMSGRLIFDLRNIVDRNAALAEGFTLHSVGQRPQGPVRRPRSGGRAAMADLAASPL
ncbi:UDP-glucose/GDP-mannose dehydrogenase family protein [Devosia sp. PTR5]|uniref:UDP-glucose 6-dehydrogenase n=1 Tax=Devosia oryzisoli TaxID=2774138 RepID=A0A927FWE7_9HYPH|nr:UDP-glucose/GDP-mannose dehydrogenase family protein [Devosia oryzisoli]MBD8066113.1 UDP-glucose/GDP-mannose dehydrogenase family protein [Devosia oryzisoli]